VNLIQALAHAIRLPELRNKILFTGGVLVIFRLFAGIIGRGPQGVAAVFASANPKCGGLAS